MKVVGCEVVCTAGGEGLPPPSPTQIAKQPSDTLTTADGSGKAPDLSQGVRN